jgi:hypothetical protein
MYIYIYQICPILHIIYHILVYHTIVYYIIISYVQSCKNNVDMHQHRWSPTCWPDVIQYDPPFAIAAWTLKLASQSSVLCVKKNSIRVGIGLLLRVAKVPSWVYHDRTCNPIMFHHPLCVLSQSQSQESQETEEATGKILIMNTSTLLLSNVST